MTGTKTLGAKTIGVILSGCGVYDGSEIYETTLTLLALSQRGLNAQIFAPNENQMHVIDHLQGQPSQENRNMLVESARIARGQISPLEEADARKLDGIIVPGGFGAAKNLCNYATAGVELEVLPMLATLLKNTHEQQKPLGFICISPIMIPALFGPGVRATLGAKGDDASAYVKMGGEHLECAVEQIVYDENHRILTTPAYMLAQNIAQAHIGIDTLVNRMADLLLDA